MEYMFSDSFFSELVSTLSSRYFMFNYNTHTTHLDPIYTSNMYLPFNGIK